MIKIILYNDNYKHMFICDHIEYRSKYCLFLYMGNCYQNINKIDKNDKFQYNLHKRNLKIEHPDLYLNIEGYKYRIETIEKYDIDYLKNKERL